MDPLVSLEVVERIRTYQRRVLTGFEEAEAHASSGSLDLTRESLTSLRVSVVAAMDLVSAVLDAVTLDEHDPQLEELLEVSASSGPGESS